ncbi:Env9p [Dipodascopsis tothii]|uniref:Env9p n=1 Tax=Dipodascopsis tothii TaxID=44089 RepID=UPI0034CD9A4D
MSRFFDTLRASGIALADILYTKPTYTEADYPDLTGKVAIVTGSTSGIGLKVTEYLLKQNAKVYICGRSQARLDTVVGSLKTQYPNASLGTLAFDYSDLATIKPGLQTFLDEEKRLDLLIHNAGASYMGNEHKTVNGFYNCLQVNAIAPFVVQKHLDDILIQTAKASPPNSVRIVWLSSLAIFWAPGKSGLQLEDVNFEKTKPTELLCYGQTKSINYFEAYVWGLRHKDSGVVSVSVHPGLIRTELTRNANAFMKKIVHSFAADVRYGVYSVLYPALSPDITTEDNGGYFIAYGKKGVPRTGLPEMASGKEGEKLWAWLEDITSDFN